MLIKRLCAQRSRSVFSIALARQALISAVVLSISASCAFAMDFAKGDNVVLGATQVIAGDWYAAGDHATLDGQVNRDAFILAQQADLRGKINQDLNLLAKTASVNSAIHGSARLACQELKITSQIPESALIVAQRLILEKGSQVGQDMAAAAYDMTLNGIIKGKIRLAANTVNVNGTLTGDITIRAQQVLVGPQARIQGTLTCFSPQPMTVSPGAQVPENAQWQKTDPKPNWKMGAMLPILAIGMIVFRLFMVITLLVAGIILISLTPASSRLLVQAVHDHPWPSLGWGALTLVGMPIAALFLVLTVIGIPLAILFVMACVLAVLLAQLTAGYLVGIIIFGEMSQRRPILAFVVGFLIFAILSFIPILGSLVTLAGILLGLGAWWLMRGQKPETVKA